MGIIYQKEQVTQEVFKGYKCNKCQEEFTDIFDTQEFLHFSDVGGYASKIGDGARWSITLCQVCMIKLLDEYIEVEEADW